LRLVFRCKQSQECKTEEVPLNDITRNWYHNDMFFFYWNVFQFYFSVFKLFFWRTCATNTYIPDKAKIALNDSR
jgi:hypothetical protein